MSQLEAFEIPGLVIVFYSNDHAPPHFHVKRRGEWELRVFFLECTATHLESEAVFSKKGKAINPTQRKDLCRLIQRHRRAVLRQWQRAVEIRG